MVMRSAVDLLQSTAIGLMRSIHAVGIAGLSTLISPNDELFGIFNIVACPGG
jgi:hypothetical protein